MDSLVRARVGVPLEPRPRRVGHGLVGVMVDAPIALEALGVDPRVSAARAAREERGKKKNVGENKKTAVSFPPPL